MRRPSIGATSSSSLQPRRSYLSPEVFRKTGLVFLLGGVMKRDLCACPSRPVEAPVKPPGCRVTGGTAASLSLRCVGGNDCCFGEAAAWAAQRVRRVG